MIDRSSRLVRKYVPLEELALLKNRRIEFTSVAEMFLARAGESPNQPLVLYYDDTIGYGEVNDRSNRVANFLKGKGVSRGDVVSVMILNSPEIYYTMFGAQKIGGVAGVMNYLLKGPEIAYLLEDARPRVCFVGSDYMEEFARGYRISSHKPPVVEVTGGVNHKERIAETTLADILASYPADESYVPQCPDDPAFLLYSSGTTGKPKGILLSNRNQLAICKGRAVMGTSLPGDIFMIILPMFHVNPLCVWTYPSLYLGLTICIRKVFSPRDFWPSLVRYGVTTVQGVPAMYHYILNAADPEATDFKKIRLRRAFTGAAPMPVDLIGRFRERFGVEVVDGYGLTEATGVSTSSSGIPPKIGSVGLAFPGLEVEIMDEENNILPCGTRGEICVKGDSVMLGYLNKPKATAEVIRDRWLHTGDMGYMDEEGYVYIAGREREMINRGGENIYPREIEIPLERHPKIAEAAVVGYPDLALGERVRACIILKAQETMTAEEVRGYLADRIAAYKLPEIVDFMVDFPRNLTGKVMKHKL